MAERHKNGQTQAPPHPPPNPTLPHKQGKEGKEVPAGKVEVLIGGCPVLIQTGPHVKILAQVCAEIPDISDCSDYDFK